MGDRTKIEWADATWNPIVGCSRVSEGCRNCYAEKLAGGRLKNTDRYKGLTSCSNGGPPKWTGETRFIEKELHKPLRWTRPRRIFVCDMGDLFHESVPHEWLRDIFGVISDCQHRECGHTFMVLTKRPERMREVLLSWSGGGAAPLPNVHLGVSVENQQAADERIPLLLQTPAAVRFISAEPLLGAASVGKYLGGHTPNQTLAEVFAGKLDWVIVGGESGSKARPMHPQWARDLRDQCKAAGTPFFFKQWGQWAPWSGHTIDEALKVESVVVMPDGSTTNMMRKTGAIVAKFGKKNSGRLLDGSGWEQLP